MSRINFAERTQGHRLNNLPNNDLDQKLTYQQLINMNHDLAKENMILQDTTRRLGQELSKLQSQFDIKPREENVELYNAIGAHPILYQYETTLIPLLDAYENKIQEFEGSFETIHEEFFTLEKKFEEICKENESLKSRITDLNKELIDVYKNQGNEKMHSDFGQIILDQINEKQRSLVDQNATLESESQKYKSLSERIESENESLQRKLDESKSNLRQSETNLSQLEIENKNLNNKTFELQIKVNETEAEKRRLEQAHERAQSQNNQLNKEKEIILSNLEKLKSRIEGDLNIPLENDQGKLIEQLQTKIAFLEAGQGPSDEYKKLQKLRKDFDELLKEKQRLKESLDNYKIKEDGLNDEIVELRSENSKLATEKSLLEKNESKVNKSLEVLKEKSKNDLVDLKKRNQEDLEKLEFEFKHKIELKNKKISELDDAIDKVRLERDRLEKENMIYGKDAKQKPAKDSERTLTKMKEKFVITEELFKEQLLILENDLAFRKKEAESNKKEIKDRTEELNQLKAEFNELKRLYEEVSEQKDSLVSEFKRVRNTYEENLKSKEFLFNEKIVEVKNAVKEAEKKRREERDNVKKVISDQKRVLEEMRTAYEGRIRELETQSTHTQYIHKEVTSTIR